MRRLAGVVVMAVLVVSACSGGADDDEVATNKGAPTPGQDVFPVVASSELVVGDNRLQIGLLDKNDAPIWTMGRHHHGARRRLRHQPVTAWGLPSEPWVFVTDSRARVVTKYEVSVAPRELTALLRTL